MKASEFYSPWEGDEAAASWDEVLAAITRICEISGNRALAWRGQANSAWSLHSSLYRHLCAAKTWKRSSGENDLFKYEKEVLKYVRDGWRDSHIPYLELLAQLQHHGAPTRLIDVSLNPLVALWFAVEPDSRGESNNDGRLFAFDVTQTPVPSTTEWFGNNIPWGSESLQKKVDWCYELPFFWRPPAYNQRIPAQYSGFLVGGVPKVKEGRNMQYRKKPGENSTWRIDEVRSVTSVPMRMNDRSRGVSTRGTPTFTFKIDNNAKEEVRMMLEDRFGIKSSTIYPDPFGMAVETKKVIEKKLIAVNFS